MMGVRLQRLFLQRLCAAILLPLILLASGGPDWTIFRCRYTHAVHLVPCCPLTAPDVAPHDEPARVAKAGCCEVRTIRLVHATFARTAATRLVLPSFVPSPLPVGLHTTVAVVARADDAAIDTGPPILLKVRSLLI